MKSISVACIVQIIAGFSRPALPGRHHRLSVRKSSETGDDDKTDLVIRNATIRDLSSLMKWEVADHLQENFTSFSEWNWEIELPREVSWRFQLIAEVRGIPIGFVQIIDPLLEETHYWGRDCEPNLRAIDIWIGEKDYLGKGWGMQMMKQTLTDYCFADPQVQAVILDPMASNTRVHEFYQRLGFRPMEERRFGAGDLCLIHRLERRDWQKIGS